MKTLLLAAAVLGFAAVMNLQPASAAEPQQSPAIAARTPHWEWQYHYVGHHPKYKGYWVWVK
ncbi:MAG TPA: hypothetical protein VET89_11875 [Stellaceae bacterium]|nr:hypothetical protein [Stellaceae bacterium]